MNLKHDYSYINSTENKLISAGYGEVTVHSIHFDRYYTEEEKMMNRELAEHMTREEHNQYCEVVSASFHKPLAEILNVFTGKYDIHQTATETSTMAHYRSNWDLYFYSNKGWNGKDYMDSFSLTFNTNRTPVQNMKLLSEIVTILENMDYKNIACRVQYDAFLYEDKIEEAAEKAFEELDGKFVECFGDRGKIRIVGESNGKKRYGLFRKGAKKKYLPIESADVLTLTFI